MDKQVNFKSSINGFDKTAVLQYIEQINQEFSAKEKDYQMQIDQLNSLKLSLENDLASMEQHTANLEEEHNKQKDLYAEQLEKQEQRYTEHLNEHEKLQNQILQQKKTIEEKERELLIQQEQNRIIKTKADSVEYKSKKYDEAAASIGGMILEARQGVNRILEDAQKQAKNIEDKANQEAYRILCDAQKNLLETNEKTQLLKAEFFDLRNQLNGSVNLINKHFDSLEKEIEEKERHLKSMMEEAQKTILPSQEQEKEDPEVFEEEDSKNTIDIPIKEDEEALSEENLDQLLQIHFEGNDSTSEE